MSIGKSNSTPTAELPEGTLVTMPALMEGFINSFLSYGHRFYFMPMPRASVKTTTAALSALIACTQGFTRVAFIREFKTSIQNSILLTAKDLIQKFNLKGFTVFRDCIKYSRTGSLIITVGLQNSQSHNVKSLENFTVWVFEECNVISGEALRRAIATANRVSKVRVLFLWNQTSEYDAIESIYTSYKRRRDVFSMAGTYLDNPFLDKAALYEIEWMRLSQPKQFKHIYMGGFADNMFKVFNNVRVREAPTLREFGLEALTIEGHLDMYMYGMDFGYSVDPTCVIRGYVAVWDFADVGGRKVRYLRPDMGGDVLVIDGEVYEYNVEYDYMPALVAGSSPVELMHDPELDNWPNPKGYKGILRSIYSEVVADSSQPGTISHISNRGINICGCLKYPGSVVEGINKINGFTEVLLHPSCNNTFREMERYCWKVDPKDEDRCKNPREPEEGNDHTVDSIRYLLEVRDRFMGFGMREVDLLPVYV